MLIVGSGRTKMGQESRLVALSEMLGFLTQLKRPRLPKEPPLRLLVSSSRIEISEIVLRERPEVGIACLLVLSCGISL